MQVNDHLQSVPLITSDLSRGGGGGHSTFKWSGCAAGGLKIGPCHKPLGAQKIHPVLIYLTKITKKNTLS